MRKVISVVVLVIIVLVTIGVSVLYSKEVNPTAPREVVTVTPPPTDPSDEAKEKAVIVSDFLIIDLSKIYVMDFDYTRLMINLNTQFYTKTWESYNTRLLYSLLTFK